MRSLRAGHYLGVVWRTSFLAGMLALPIGCDRVDAVATQPPAPRSQSAVQKQALSVAVAPPSPATSPSPIEPGGDGLDDLKRALARKFDPSQMRTQPASPQGGILHIPNGHVAHAAILVKNPDGTVRRECVSSSAEVSALVDQIRQGGGR